MSIALPSLLPPAFSAGLAQWQGDESPEQIVKRADTAMYQAKSSGRGRVMVAEGH